MTIKVERYYAHSGGHPLSEHLRSTARWAAKFAEVFGGGREAQIAGLLHDIGKYRREFQEYLAGLRSSSSETHHSAYGATYAGRKEWWASAFAIAGHHAGVHDRSDLQSLVNDTQHDTGLSCLKDIFTKEVGKLPTEVEAPAFVKPDQPLSYEFYIRMLFSCLVDADYLDTEEAKTGRRRQPVRLCDIVDDLFDRLDKERRGKSQEGPVNQIRHKVFEQCVAKAELSQGFFSLTVPTGGGKTISGMAFALAHARKWNLKRIIVVIPYLSIIEQNAAEYRRLLDPANKGIVVEHHSSVPVHERGEDEPPLPAELAAENWDAPIIVTTSVQFIESLFARLPSKCRKLHNIAKSVVILDEVQTLPTRLLKPLLSVFRELKENYGVSFLFMTATQPAFEKPENAPETDLRWLKGVVTEIIETPQKLFDDLKRVTVSWPGTKGLPTKSTWDEVADMMAAEPRSLCVLNMRNHAAILYQGLLSRGSDKTQTWCLTTRKCPKHRLDTIGAIRSALQKGGATCRVVSTQLVEAGVDLDFPIVFRAMGPLDSIAQAAGRCDREGKLTAAMGHPAGRVVVFEPDIPANQATPSGAYYDATTITRTMSEGGTLSIHDVSHIRGYFNRYYQNDLDPEDIDALRSRLLFKTVAERAVVIDDPSTPVFVPYNTEAKALIQELEKKGGGMDLFRRLQRYQIGFYERELDQAQRNGAVYEIIKGTGIWCCDERFYKDDLGFVMESTDPLIA